MLGTGLVCNTEKRSYTHIKQFLFPHKPCSSPCQHKHPACIKKKKISLLSSPTTSLCCGLLRNSMQISSLSVLDPQLAGGITFKTSCYSETTGVKYYGVNNSGIRVLSKTVRQERDTISILNRKQPLPKILSLTKHIQLSEITSF